MTALRGLKKLVLDFTIFPGKAGFDVLPVALARGLRQLTYLAIREICMSTNPLRLPATLTLLASLQILNLGYRRLLLDTDGVRIVADLTHLQLLDFSVPGCESLNAVKKAFVDNIRAQLPQLELKI